jgi:hypothetical protein
MADFDKGIEELTGSPPPRDDDTGYRDDEAMWNAVRNCPHFYAQLEPMPDSGVLWSYVKNYFPTFLSGIPDIEGASEDKRTWVTKFFGKDIPLITCKSKNKIFYAKEVCKNNEIPILIDDWIKWKHVWEDNGGIFILHTSAVDSIEKLLTIVGKGEGHGRNY